MKAGLLAGLILGIVQTAWAYPVFVCEKADHSLLVGTLTELEPTKRADVLRRLQDRGRLPGMCVEMDSSALPSETRPDPYHPGEGISQYHRWRLDPAGRVFVDPTVMSPRRYELLRAIRTILGLRRYAELLVSSPGGREFLLAIRENDWVLAKALLPQLSALTLQEVDEIRAAARVYETSLD